MVAVPQPAGAAETSPIGFGAGTTGGGSTAPVTVSGRRPQPQHQ
jgi:pectate lyase